MSENNISITPLSTVDSLYYVDVLFPLALEGYFTYVLPAEFLEKVKVGVRVIAPLGKRKFYAAIVMRIHQQRPEETIKLKAITDVMDQQPLILLQQINIWKWMADYYLCTLGEVYKAALPSGLKLESECFVVREADYEEQQKLKGVEISIWDALSDGKPQRISQLEKTIRCVNTTPIIRRLIDKGAVKIQERLNVTYHPKTELHVRLASEWMDESKLNILFQELKRASKQEHLLLTYLSEAKASTAISLKNPKLLISLSRDTLLKKAGTSLSVLKALIDRKVLEVYKVSLDRLKNQKDIATLASHPLNDFQKEAYKQILSSFQTKNVCLLHGVTSSGKTEVYIHLIQKVLAEGRQVLYLLPEIALTTQITSRLHRVFGDVMGVYHSKFPDAERVEVWKKQLSEKPYQLILGVRSSLFLPFKNIGLIIVDEEHESSYKQNDPAPRYLARDTAIMMAYQLKAKVLLGTATPSFETFHNVSIHKYAFVEMKERFGDALLPEIFVENLVELRRKRMMKSIFSPRLFDEIKMALENEEQVILFQNRRGYSPIIECKTCGWVPTCSRCDVKLTYHSHQNQLVCHYCGNTYKIPDECPNCGSQDLRNIGYGTEMIEEKVQEYFPQAHIARMDLDTTRSRTSYEKIINDFQKGSTDILVGTQMVTKGLDFEKVHVVGILNADTMLNQPNFRSHEHAFQMMSQVAGRAGRRKRRGIVIIQTKQPDLPVIERVVNNDYEGLYKSELPEREDFLYPPYCRIIDIYLKHRDDGVVQHASEALANDLVRSFGDDILGPDRPFVSRIQLLYIRKIMVKVALNYSQSSVRSILRDARLRLLSDSCFRSVKVYFDVDPI